MIADVFVALYVGHMVGDHVVQTDHQAAHKSLPGGRGWRAMAGHIVGYGIAQYLAVGLVLLIGTPVTWWGAFAALAFSLGTHAFIDRRWPVKWLLEHTGSKAFASLGSPSGPQVGLNGPYLTDQALHIGCLFIAAWLAAFLSGGGA